MPRMTINWESAGWREKDEALADFIAEYAMTLLSLYDPSVSVDLVDD